MKIAACIKYSLDVSEVKVDASTKQIRLAGVPKKLGNIDRNVLETAATLKETYGGTVHLFTFGPPEAKNILKEALGVNADDATLILEPSGEALDPGATVAVLAAALKKLGSFDVIVCGEASDDGFTYQVGPRLAETLGMPQITYARKITIENGSILAERDWGEGAELVKAPLPVLLTVTEETNTPRRPTLMDLVKAKKKPLVEWQLEKDLGISPQTLQDASGLQLLATEGIVVERKQILLKDKPTADLASELVDLLVQENLLEG